jgi:SMI1-KNR4 cell-wall
VRASNSLKRLIRLVAPPIPPADAGRPDQWDDVERALGITLPNDYKQFINAFGTGEFNDLLWIYNPFSSVESMNLLWQAGVPESLENDEELGRVCRLDSDLDRYYGFRCEDPEDYPLPPYPEPGGLLPVGGDSNGGYMWWLTAGEPDAWPLVRLPHGLRPVEQHELPLVEFLVQWLSGKLPESFGRAGGSFAEPGPVFLARRASGGRRHV